jgi:hypothetical protein
MLERSSEVICDQSVVELQIAEKQYCIKSLLQTESRSDTVRRDSSCLWIRQRCDSHVWQHWAECKDVD